MNKLASRVLRWLRYAIGKLSHRFRKPDVTDQSANDSISLFTMRQMPREEVTLCITLMMLPKSLILGRFLMAAFW